MKQEWNITTFSIYSRVQKKMLTDFWTVERKNENGGVEYTHTLLFLSLFRYFNRLNM